ncbi:MAG: P-loop NTPase, partial [Verrucomicrobiae bacterium]|nr:P-loop NTPase [Verrucomicrobiae bacterium]
MFVKRELPVLNGLDVAEQLNKDLPAVAVILILTGRETEEVWHRMLRIGIRQFVTKPYDAVKFHDELHKALAEKQRTQAVAGGPAAAATEQTAAPANRVVTVTGPRGGCGKSVLATNLAVALTNQSERVALVDLNLWGGDIAMLLDLQPRRTLGDLLPGFGGIDNDVIESVITKHSSGVSVIAAPITGQFDGTTLSRHIVTSILESLREHYEATIVDTGYANLESTVAAMDASDT